jgi:hypothetical protein
MEIRRSNKLKSQNSFSELNGKYAKIVDHGSDFGMHIQRIRQDDDIFRAQSHDKLDKVVDMNTNVLGGNLFISGISAPVSIIRERKAPPKKYIAPLPKTRRNNIQNSSAIPPIHPLHGFGSTNMRYFTESVLSDK